MLWGAVKMQSNIIYAVLQAVKMRQCLSFLGKVHLSQVFVL